MGVTGLWKLIEPCGQPLPVEMLESKILAVDISIWLHQVVKGFQDHKGSALANAHLLGLFHRLCKLMYYRIKPIFVFDGKVPHLKKETIAKRSQSRNKLMNEADRIQTLLLQSLAKEKVVQQALGTQATAELLKISPSKNKTVRNRADMDDMFKLPDLPAIKDGNGENEPDTSVESTCSSDTESSFEESKPRQHYDQNLQAIDVKSRHFRNLPAEIRHEILIDIKETRKQSSWGKLHELPSKSNDFSIFQMKRLLKRRQVQESIEEVQREMDGVRTFTMSELEHIFSEEGIIETTTLPNAKHISSDSGSRYLLVQDLKKTLALAGNEAKELESKPSSPRSKLKNKNEEQAELGEDYEADLQKAIQMSLEESAPYDEKDYDYDGELKLNKEQRKHLKNAAVGLARAYMIEHAGMNDDDVQGLLENTQAYSDDEECNYTFSLNDSNAIMTKGVESLDKEAKSETYEKKHENPHTSSFCLIEENKGPERIWLQGFDAGSTNIQETNRENEEYCNKRQHIQRLEIEAEEVGIISGSDSDSEFEEVTNSNNTVSQEEKLNILKSELEIFVNPTTTGVKEDDLFADIFSPRTGNNTELKPSASNVAEILLDLKKQVFEATKVNLTDIKLDPSVVEISDDESVHLSQCLIKEFKTQRAISKETTDITTINNIGSSSTIPNHEIPKRPEDKLAEATDYLPDNKKKIGKALESSDVIEIVDDLLPNNGSTSFQTPSKKKSIDDFFQTKFVIKRTPEKPIENTESTPKVQSPFFVKKTPKSSAGKSKGKRNVTDDEVSPLKKANKAAKMLFEKCDSDDDIEIEDLKKKYKEQSEMEMAVNTLKEKKTQDELKDLASSLAKEKIDLEKERNRQERMGMSISERMHSECMELLRLFGVPYIVAPMEAEAQCAFLDAVQLTNGTITDDSDIWLFGGRTVYKNFFAQNKHVLEYKSEKIENSFNMDRRKMIQLAMLVGSDYTTGINGIGAVTALEILATFSENSIKDSLTEQQTAAVLATLQHFRDWWANAKTSMAVGNSTRHRLRNKLKNIEIIEGFPNPLVVEAYLLPTVDNSQETFTWGTPDVESLREFTKMKFGWTRLKTDEILGPVLKKLNEKKSQSTITNYFALNVGTNSKKLPVSKRVQNAITKMSADYNSDEEKTNEKSVKISKQRKRKQNEISIRPSEANEVMPKKATRPKKNVKIPRPEVIPQREKNLEEMEHRKQLAAAVLKQSKTTRAKK